MKKIQRASQFLHAFFITLCWLIPLIIAYLILFNMEDMLLHWGIWTPIIPVSQIHNTHYTFIHRFVILAIELFPLSMSIMVFNNLAKLFSLYGEGILFEEENIKLIKGISIYMILGILAGLIYQPLISAALTFNNPIGERYSVLNITSTNISTLVTALIILIASWILQEANLLKTDSQLNI